MAIHNISPFFMGDSAAFAFTNKELNFFARTMYTDTFGFYQQAFNLFGFMQLNNLNKFRVHSPKGSPLVWKPYTGCSYSSGQNLMVGVTDYEPDPFYLKEKFCDDVLIDSAYEQLLEWSNNDIAPDAEGMRIIGAVVEEYLANAALGLRAMATSGGLYDVNAVTFEDNVTEAEKAAFILNHPAMSGWMKVARDKAALDSPWMDLNIVHADDFDAVTGYTGEIVELYDKLRTSARKPLRNLINRGGTFRDRRFAMFPLFVVSDSFFQAVVARYLFEAERVATNAVRVTRREFGGQDGSMPQFVYYIDNTPIIPLDEINIYDNYITNDTHFAGIIASTNIQIGTSYAPVDNIEGNPIGLAVDKVTDRTRDDYRSWSMLSLGLGKAAIADPDYFVGTIFSTTS